MKLKNLKLIIFTVHALRAYPELWFRGTDENLKIYIGIVKVK